MNAAHHRLQVPARDERKACLELPARGAVHRQHRLVAQEQLRGVERHEVAGELAHENPAAVHAEAAAHGVERDGTDVVDHRVHTFAAGQLAHAPREIFPAPRDEHDVRAQRFEQGHLVGRRGLRDHVRAGQARELHGVHAHAASGAGDQHGIVDRDPPDVAYRVQRRADRAGRDRGLLVGDVVRDAHDVVVLDRDVLGVAADEAVIAQKTSFPAQRLEAAAAEAAHAADVVALRGGHPVARPYARHLAADFLDDAGDLVTRDDGKLDPGLHRAVAHDDVVEAHAAGGDADQHVAGTHARPRDLLGHEDVDPAGGALDDGAHQPSPLHTPLRSEVADPAGSARAVQYLPALKISGSPSP